MTFDIHETAHLTLKEKQYTLRMDARLPGPAATTSTTTAAAHQSKIKSLFHASQQAPSGNTSGAEGYLSIRLMDEEDGTIWAGDYSPAYIEDITTKTGNYKRFSVFVKMLVSALKEITKTVFLDLLTYQDLLALKQGMPRTAPSVDAQPSDKRYLIMTYAVAFDRVHYPMPLKHTESRYSGNELKDQYFEVKKEMAEMRQERQDHMERITQLLRENDHLRHELKYSSQQDVTGATGAAEKEKEVETVVAKKSLEADKDLVMENLKLKREFENLVRERHSVEKAFSELRDETRNEFQSIQKEFRRLTKEVSTNVHQNDHLDFQLGRCYNLIEQLLEELKQEKMKSQQLLAQRNQEVRTLKEEIQRLRSANLASGHRSTISSSVRKRQESNGSVKRVSAGRRPESAPGRRGDLSSVRSTPVRRSPAPSPARSATSQGSFKRFDPTAYVRERESRMEERRARSVASQRSLSRSSSVDSRPSTVASRTNRFRPNNERPKQESAWQRRSNYSQSSLQQGSPRPYRRDDRPRDSPRPNRREDSFGGRYKTQAKPVASRPTDRPRQVEFQHRSSPAKRQSSSTLLANKENARHAKVSEVSRVGESLKALSVNDIDARLSVLQSYFDSLRDN